jgi:hypothetical protein
MKTSKQITRTLIVFLGLIAFGACATQNHGNLKSNRQVAESFKKYEVLPNHKYYYRGALNNPVAIVGINENDELNSNMWVEIDPESKRFRQVIDLVFLQGMTNAVQPWGQDIFDRDGGHVGIWYSAITTAAVGVNENNQIVRLIPSRTVAIGEQK